MLLNNSNTKTPPPTCSFCGANHTRLVLKPLSRVCAGINGISKQTYKLAGKNYNVVNLAFVFVLYVILPSLL
jgi:hypothetical protein